MSRSSLNHQSKSHLVTIASPARAQHETRSTFRWDLLEINVLNITPGYLPGVTKTIFTVHIFQINIKTVYSLNIILKLDREVDRGDTCLVWLWFQETNKKFCETINNHNGSFARYVKLWVVHAPGMPGTFSPLPRVSDRDGGCARHSRRMRKPQFCVSGKRPMDKNLALVIPALGGISMCVNVYK